MVTPTRNPMPPDTGKLPAAMAKSLAPTPPSPEMPAPTAAKPSEPEHGGRNVGHLVILDEAHAHRLDTRDLLDQFGARQAVGRDAVV